MNLTKTHYLYPKRNKNVYLLILNKRFLFKNYRNPELWRENTFRIHPQFPHKNSERRKKKHLASHFSSDWKTLKSKEIL